MQGGQWAALATVLRCLPLEETSPEGKEILIFLPIFMRKCSSCTIAKRKKGLPIILPAIWQEKVPLFPLQLTAGEKIKAQAKLLAQILIRTIQRELILCHLEQTLRMFLVINICFR